MCVPSAGALGAFGGAGVDDLQSHGVDRVTPSLPLGAFGEERAMIKRELFARSAKWTKAMEGFVHVKSALSSR